MNVWRFSDGTSYVQGQPVDTSTVLGVNLSARLKAAVGERIGPQPGVLPYDPLDVRHVHYVVTQAVRGLGTIVSAPPGAERPIDWPAQAYVPGRVY